MQTVQLKKENISLVVGVVAYGDRYNLLQKVIEAILKEDRVTNILVVDNNSKNKIQDLVFEKYKNSKSILDKFKIITNTKNYGSAGGYAQLINECRKYDTDYILLLDDDNVPEYNFLDLFLDNLEYIKSLDTKIDKSKIVLCGNRNILNSKSAFTNRTILNHDKTFFSIFSFKKIKGFVKNICFKILTKDCSRKSFKDHKNESPNVSFLSKIINSCFDFKYKSFFKTSSFGYGGTLLPMSAILEAKLPDSKLFLYGDDIEYSWNVNDAGYDIYACDKPIISDIDISFADGSHITGPFLKGTPDIKVYFNMRNRALVSMRNTKNILSKIFLIINIILWVIFFSFYALFKIGIFKVSYVDFFHKLKIILLALHKGFNLNYGIPKFLNMRDDSEILKSVV